MKHLILALALTLGGIAAPAHLHAQSQADMASLEDMSNAEIMDVAETLHPAALYVLSARLAGAGNWQEAAKWMYIAQLRYRIMLAAGADGDDSVLFSALHEQVGRPVNEYIGGNVDEWLGAIDAALEWDATHDNGTNPKDRFASVIEQERQGMRDLRAQIEANRDDIPRQREENGLENR